MATFVPSMQSSLADANAKIEAEQAARAAGAIENGQTEAGPTSLVALVAFTSMRRSTWTLGTSFEDGHLPLVRCSRR